MMNPVVIDVATRLVSTCQSFAQRVADSFNWQNVCAAVLLASGSVIFDGCLW